MTQLPSVTINGLALSDLFFNSKLENWDNDCTKENLLKDAEAFVLDYGIDINPSLLVDDFLARL